MLLVRHVLVVEGAVGVYEVDRIIDRARLVVAATKRRPFGPAFSVGDAEKASELIIEATAVTDSGPDCICYTLKDALGNVIARVEVPGH
jgi:hypothetical protein